MKHIAVIGGGAAGLVAAIMAARHGAAVAVYERMQRVGKKLLATGNGRCNIANRQLDSSRYHSQCPGFIDEVFAQFGLDQTLAFFEDLGISVVEEDGGKLFPMSQQASSVLDVLRYEAERLGVREICETSIHAIETTRRGLRLVSEKDSFTADAAIISTGGKSSPNLGSNGGGHKLAQALGHKIIEPFPALVQVKLDAPYLNQLAGVALEGKAEVRVNGKAIDSETGELLFTKYGISGTAILQVSRTISEHTLKGHFTQLCLDLFSSESIDDLINIIRSRFAHSPHKTIAFSFVGFIHKRVIPVILQLAEIPETHRPCGQLSSDEIRRLAATLKEWTIPCTGTQSWMFSQVTAGGVSLNEIDPRTMASRRNPNIYFAGEVLDVDGDSGGYNLQWAWSTGVIAGTHAAQEG